jgi:Uma2 family endonuclease
MSIAHISPTEIHYPSSDSLPMGETPLHRRWMVYIDNVFERRYRGQRAYLGCDMFVYYVAGDPKKFIVPDNFIALGCEPGDRDVYKTWEDPPPNVVFEVSSKSTRQRDREVKPETYVRVGVREIILYDPRGEAQPALHGLRIVDRTLVPIEPDASGAIESEELGVILRLAGNSLAIADRQSGEILHTDCEAYSAELAKVTEEAAASDRRAAIAEKGAAANAAQAAASDRRATTAEQRAAANAAEAAAAKEEIRKLREALQARGIDPEV